MFGSKQISIHAPARGATAIRALLDLDTLFQSTLPRGERQGHCVRSEYTAISIHAPARGATAASGQAGGDIQNFNPRSREGSDDLSGSCQRSLVISIHAPARGATRMRSSRPCSWYFNPRSREGSDNLPARLCAVKEISIHAPARGATL